MFSHITSMVLILVVATGAAAGEPGSGIYGKTCGAGSDVYRVNIRSDGQGEVQIGETTFLELLTSYSYYGDGTPADFHVAILFNRDTSPIAAGADGDPRLEIWQLGATYYALINGNPARKLRFCEELDTPGATADMPYSNEQFDVVGYLECGLLEAEMKLSCPFGVQRGDPGFASLTLRTPLDTERTLNFNAGTFLDAGQEPVEGDLADGFWTLEVGEEHYRFAEEVLKGG